MATTIWKFPLFTDGRAVVDVEMPVGAEIVRFGIQFVGPILDKPRQGHPTVWALCDEEAAKETRRFAVVGTGHPLPDGAAYIDSYDAEPFVWHVIELPLPVPDQVAALPLAAQNAYRTLVKAGFGQRWDSGTHAWVAPAPDPLTTEQMMAVAELQEHGFGLVVES